MWNHQITSSISAIRVFRITTMTGDRRLIADAFAKVTTVPGLFCNPVGQDARTFQFSFQPCPSASRSDEHTPTRTQDQSRVGAEGTKGRPEARATARRVGA